jgi:hypothetical protein
VYCAEHGEAAWRAAAPPPRDAESQAASLAAQEESWRSLPEAQKEHLALLYHLTTHRG